MRIPRDAVRTTSFIVVGLTVLACAFFVWLLTVAASSSMAHVTERVTKAVAEAQARNPRRPVIRGEAVPGSAWAEYEHGLALAKGVVVADVRNWLDGTTAADRTKAEAVLAANGTALKFLRAGARKADGAYPVRWEHGTRADVPSLMAVKNLTALAVGQARVLLEAGKPKEAAELLLDAAQFGADAGRNTTLIGELTALSSLAEVFDGLKTLPPDAEVGRALAVLDATFPNHGETLLNELTVTGVTFTELGRGFAVPAGWRFGFSQGAMLAEAWTTLEDLMHRTAATTTAPWAEARRLQAEIEMEARRSSNPIVQTMIPSLLRAHQSSREGLARLRMLRVLHGRATGLADPFGGTLLSDGAKVWSLGADGIDGGGAGAWKPAPTGDIVLELPPR